MSRNWVGGNRWMWMKSNNRGAVERPAPVVRSYRTAREGTMIRRAYWSGLAAILLALAFATGCNNRTAGGPPVSLTVVTAMSPFAQSSTINNPTVATPVAFASPFQAMVTTTATPG